MKYTKKRKIINKYKRRSRKNIWKGGNLNTSVQDKNLEKINEEVIASHPGLNEKVSETVSKVGENLQGVAINTLDYIGDNFGVDITNTEDVERKIKGFNEVLSDPDIKRELNKTATAAGEYATIVAKASEPAVKEFAGIVEKSIAKASSEIGEDLANIAMNTLEAIPGPGAFIGLVRDIDKGTQAVESAFAAASDISIAATDAIQKTSKNIENIKNNIDNPNLNNTSLNNSLNNSVNNSLNTKLNNNNVNNLKGGGSLKRRIINYKRTMKRKNDMMKKIGGSIQEFHNSTLFPNKILRK
jgi:hypothetical protein